MGRQQMDDEDTRDHHELKKGTKKPNYLRVPHKSLIFLLFVDSKEILLFARDSELERACPAE